MSASTRGRSSFAAALVARAGGLACACALFGGNAHAETPPSVWELARDPAEVDRWALHERVERLLASPNGGSGVSRMEQELRCEAAFALLEEAHAADSPDVRLRFDLGIVYSQLATLQGRTDLLEKVVAVLAPALAIRVPGTTGTTGLADADDSAATRALEALVYAYAKLDRPTEELATWQRYIPLLLDDRVRANAMMNMGEAQMRLGYAEDALVTFREVLRLCGELPNTTGVQSTYVLALWDVAVALDRSGDPRGAVDTAAKASRMDLGGRTGATLITKDPDVFFVPEWERLWYLALGAAAEARDAENPRDAAVLWAAVERARTQYVEQATIAAGPTGAPAPAPGASPWLPIARVRLEQARARRRAADERVAKLPPVKAPPTAKEPRWIGN